MAQEVDVIDNYIDRTGVKADTDFMLENLNKIYQALLSINSIKLGLSGATTISQVTGLAKDLQSQLETLAESEKKLNTVHNQTVETNKKVAESNKTLYEQAAQIKQAQAQVSEQIKKLKDDFKDGTVSQEDFTKSMAKFIQQQSALSVSANDVSRAIRNIEKVNQSAEGSLNELRGQLNLALQAFDKLSASQKGSAQGSELLAEIERLTKAITEEEEATGRFQRNVGNYKGSAKIIVDSLKSVENEITKLQQKQKDLQNFQKTNPIGFRNRGGEDDLKQTNALLDQAQQKFTALDNITKQPQFLNIAGKVGDTTREIGFFKNRLVELEDAGLKNDDVYKQVQARLAHLTDQIGDTRAEVKALASDTRSFDLFAGSVSFAADAFQTFAGAAALAGKSEEDVAKITKTLIAVQSVSNGVKGIAVELTTKGTAANRALNFVVEQGSIVFGKGATAAARFGAAIQLTGIGLAITAITVLISKMVSMTENTKEADKALEEYDVTLENTNKIMDRQIQKIERRVQLEIELAKRRGRNDTEIKKIEEQGLEDQLAGFDELSKKRNEALKDTLDKQAKISHSSFLAAQNIGVGLDEFNELAKGGVTTLSDAEDLLQRIKEFKTTDTFKGFSETSKKQAELVQKNVQGIVDVLTRADDTEFSLALARSKRQTESTQDTRKNLEAERKAYQDFFQYLLQQQAQEQRNIADAELFPTEARIKALEKEKEIKRLAIQEQLKFELQAENLSASQIQFIHRKAADELIAIDTKFLIESTQIRLQANKTFIDEAEAQSAELEAREASDNQKKIDDLVKSEKAQLDVLAISGDNKLAELNNQYSRGIIDKKTFEKKKKEEEARILKESLLIQIDYYDKLLKMSNVTGQARTDAEKELARLRKELAKIGIGDQSKTFEEAIKTLDDIKNYGNQVADVIGKAFDAAATAQKNRIQEQIDALDKQKEKDIEVANQTILNEKDKDAAIAVIEARANARKEALERRQKEIDERKAKFDKAASLFNITINTAQAVTKFLSEGSIGLAIAAGILGAAEFAIAAAAPIPKYKYGTQDHPGGLAEVGHGKPEVVVLPSGETYKTPATPVTVNLPKHTMVYPDVDSYLDTLIGHQLWKQSNVDVTSAFDITSLKAEMSEQNSLLAQQNNLLKQMVDKPVLNMKADHGGLSSMWQWGANQIKYLNDQTNWNAGA